MLVVVLAQQFQVQTELQTQAVAAVLVEQVETLVATVVQVL
jgi:hypothetical protein